MTPTRLLLIATTAAALAAGLAGCGRPTEQGGAQGSSNSGNTPQGGSTSMGTPGASGDSASAAAGVSGTNAGGSTTGVPNAAMPSSAPGAGGSTNSTSPPQPGSGPASS